MNLKNGKKSKKRRPNIKDEETVRIDGKDAWKMPDLTGAPHLKKNV